MKKPESHSRLTTVFFRYFFLMVVIPILLTAVISTGVIRNIMLKNAREKIQLAQENVVNTLDTEINDAMLKLSHFVLANESSALELAVQMYKADGQEKYDLNNELKELFNYIVTPNSDILAVHFYYWDGTAYCFKDQLAVPLEDLQKMDWYRNTLNSPNRTCVGDVSSTVTYKSLKTDEGQLALVVGFSPRISSQMNKVEMVCLYVNTKVAEMIPGYNENETQGEMYLIDDSGRVLVSPDQGGQGYELPEELYTKSSGAYYSKQGGKTLHYVVSQVPSNPSWRIVSVADNDTLLEGFNRLAWVLIGVSLLLFALFFLFSLLFLKNIITPVNHLMAGMERVENGNMDTRVSPSGQKELRTLVHSFNRMVRNMKELMMTRDREEKERYQAEIRALQSQINPHFLVNTLNSIRFVAMAAKFEGIKNMAEALMKILSASFKKSASLYTVAEEVEMLESYLYLMQIRYSYNFTVTYDIQQEAKQCRVPRLILQPIVENSIVHGFEEMIELGEIHVSACRDGSRLTLTVQDNGCGMSREKVKGLLEKTPDGNESHGIGVANVNRRIRLTFGEGYGLEIESEPGKGSRTTLKLPAQALDEEETQDV